MKKFEYKKGKEDGKWVNLVNEVINSDLDFNFNAQDETLSTCINDWSLTLHSNGTWKLE